MQYILIFSSILIAIKLYLIFLLIKQLPILKIGFSPEIWLQIKAIKQTYKTNYQNFASKLIVFIPEKSSQWSGKIIEIKSQKLLPVSNYQATFSFFGLDGAKNIRDVLKQRQKQELNIQRALRKVEKKIASKFHIDDISIAGRILPILLIVATIGAILLFIAVDNINDTTIFLLIPCFLAIVISIFAVFILKNPIIQINTAVSLINKMKLVANIKLLDEDDDDGITVTPESSKLKVFDPKASRELNKNAKKLLLKANAPISKPSVADKSKLSMNNSEKLEKIQQNNLSVSKELNNIDLAKDQVKSDIDDVSEETNIIEKITMYFNGFLQKLKKKNTNEEEGE